MDIGVVLALLVTATIEAPASAAAAPGSVPLRSDADALSGAYRWESGGYVEIQAWNELGPGRLVAFDDEGWVRALTSTGQRAFTVGVSIAVPEPVGARVRFEPAEGSAPATTLVWEVEGQPPRSARRIADARDEAVTFRSGTTTLAGTLFLPTTAGRHPALVLVHGSGEQDRNGVLPFARYLVRHGVAILAYDKRGVGSSEGDWRTSSFDALADDVLSGVAYLRTRPDIDRKRIGLLGVSQGGWIGPLAASRSRTVALVVSVSGPGVSPAEQTLDLIESELRLNGVPDDQIREASDLTKLAFKYSRTGAGWDEYVAALARSKDREWLPYLPLPATAQDPAWDMQRLFFHYDPGPALVALRCPVLAVFGGRDSGIPVDKNRARWKEGLERGRHRDHDLVVVPTADHIMLEAKTGSMYEIPALDRFVPDYRKIVLDWLSSRFRLQERLIRAIK